MRVSCDPNDHGFQEWNQLGDTRYSVKVFLDGVEMRGVITADEEAGMIVRYRVKENGLLIVQNGDILRETLYGAVELH